MSQVGYAQNTIMDAKDSVSGSLATCFVTVNGQRLNFMQLTEFESHWKPNIVKVPILGKNGTGHKPVGGEGTFSGVAHYNQSVLRIVADTYQKTGVMPYTEIQVSNEDPTSSVGRQTVVHHDCLFDDFTLAKFNAGDAVLDEDVSGTFERWDLPEKFNVLEGM